MKKSLLILVSLVLSSLLTTSAQTIGDLWGLTYAGGALQGVAFKYSHSTYTIMHDFGAINDGSEPKASLIEASDSNLYGMTEYGGISSNLGTIFKCTPSGIVTVLHTFTGTPSDGSYPNGNLIQANDGNFYGMTQYGGDSNEGTIFKCTPTGIVTVLHSFIGGNGDGLYPLGDLIQANDGNLYGMTESGGGGTNAGIIFKCTLSGTVTMLFSFGSVTPVSGYPIGSLVQANDGNLYGMAGGGASTKGIIFKSTPSGTLTVLHNFTGASGDGSYPSGNLIQANDGNLYGMTGNGGDSNAGTIFKCTLAGTVTLLHSFTGDSADGAHPSASLIQASDSNLYGMTNAGGTSNKGIIFKFTLSGVITDLENFNGTNGFLIHGNLLEYKTNPTSTNQLRNNVTDISVYPIPSKGHFIADLKGYRSESITVYDEVGKAILKQSLKNEDRENIVNVDMSNYTAGIYFVQIITNQGVIDRKIIIQK